MRERWKRIRTGLLMLVFVIAGVLEYIQLMSSFDIPQVILVMPVVGALAYITLRKYSFLVLVCTIFLCCAYQIVAGSANAIQYLQTTAPGIARILLYVLPVCMLFELLGIGGGALIRVLINRKTNPVVGILCLLAGLVVVLGPYEFLYQNPLYPIQARMALREHAEKTYTDYPISEKAVYFDMATSRYQCRVSMADGALHLIYFDDEGNVVAN